MNDDRYTLPDLPSQAVPGARHQPAAGHWSQDDLQRWLDSPRLAAWVGDWVESLRPTLGEALPRLFGRGLGEAIRYPAWMASNSPDPTWLRQYLARSDVAAAWFEEGFLQDDPHWLIEVLRAGGAAPGRCPPAIQGARSHLSTLPWPQAPL